MPTPRNQTPTSNPATQELLSSARQIIHDRWSARLSLKPGQIEEVELDPSGSGVLLIRAGSAQQADVLRSCDEQFAALSRYLAEAGHTARCAICAVGMGIADMESRPDLQRLFALADEPWCRFVAVADAYRISRNHRVSGEAMLALERSGVRLRIPGYQNTDAAKFTLLS